MGETVKDKQLSIDPKSKVIENNVQEEEEKEEKEEGGRRGRRRENKVNVAKNRFNLN